MAPRWSLSLQLAALVLCGAASGAGAVSLHKFDKAQHNLASITDPRLHIISVTGTPMMERAVVMQDALERWMSPRDSYTTICDVGCAEASSNRLKQVAEMPSTVWPAGGVCRRHGRTCTGHEMSGVKFIWGLFHAVSEAKLSGKPMPEWFLLKDDDTYVDAEALMQSVSNYSFATDLVSMASFDHPEFVIGSTMSPMSGGAGWLLSRVGAENLVKIAGHRGDNLAEIVDRPTGPSWLEWQVDQLTNHDDFEMAVAYDDMAHHIIKQVPGMQLLDHPAMSWMPCHCVNGTRTAATCHLKNWLDAYDMATSVAIADCGLGDAAVTSVCKNC